MRASAFSRLLAVILICIPVAWRLSFSAARNLDQIRTNPAGYLQHVWSLQHPGFLYHFVTMFVALGALTFLIEGLAQFIGRWLPEKREQVLDAGSAKEVP